MNKFLFSLSILVAGPGVGSAQFVDPFDSINPAWVTDRYAPSGFDAVSFNGDNRLRITIDATGSTANRDVAFSDEFFSFQGNQRSANLTGQWTVSAQVYVSAAFNTTTGPLVMSALWGHSGTTPEGGAYLTLGFTNTSPTDGKNPDAVDRSFRFQAWDASINNWINLGLPVGFQFDAWHTLSGTSNGTAFEYRIDGDLVHNYATARADDLLSVMVESYNFDQAGSYSVYWDNVTVSAIPEPATTVLIMALTAMGLAGWQRRRALRLGGKRSSFCKTTAKAPAPGLTDTPSRTSCHACHPLPPLSWVQPVVRITPAIRPAAQRHSD